jgi:ATP-dependent DNA helicase RecG
MKLNKIGLYNVQDLLFHLPLRYIDRTKITPIGGIQPRTEVVIEGEVRASDIVFGRRRSLVCRLQDQTGTTTLRFFHFNKAQQQKLKAGCLFKMLWGSSPRFDRH